MSDARADCYEATRCAVRAIFVTANDTEKEGAAAMAEKVINQPEMLAEIERGTLEYMRRTFIYGDWQPTVRWPR